MQVFQDKKSNSFHDSICKQWNECKKLTAKQPTKETFQGIRLNASGFNGYVLIVLSGSPAFRIASRFTGTLKENGWFHFFEEEGKQDEVLPIDYFVKRTTITEIPLLWIKYPFH